MKKTYELNGKTYETLTAIAKELGVKRVYGRDLDKLGIKEIIEDDAPAVDTAVDTQDNAVVGTADAQDDKNNDGAKTLPILKMSR